MVIVFETTGDKYHQVFIVYQIGKNLRKTTIKDNIGCYNQWYYKQNEPNYENYKIWRKKFEKIVLFSSNH